MLKENTDKVKVAGGTRILGIHHAAALTRYPAANLRCHTELLGLPPLPAPGTPNETTGA